MTWYSSEGHDSSNLQSVCQIRRTTVIRFEEKSSNNNKKEICKNAFEHFIIDEL